jgi:glutathione S-transferase
MELVAAVISIALLVYMYITFQVGSARTKYGVEAPAISGHPVFERTYRVQLNTIEQLVVFLPSIWIFGLYVNAGVAAALGLVFVLGRALYFVGYVKDPAKRTTGFLLTFLPNVILLLGALIGAVLQVF